ncbi:response regulator [Patescibacteria group bacterium]|nr:response regulator [Patescibacteria group bacterium]
MAKILIIEDDTFLADLLVNHLKKEGLEVSFAPDAEKAFKEIQKSKPELIILDLILPGMDGYEFLKKIKDDKALASIPVVVLSNLGLRDEVERAKALGAKDFLIKAQFDLKDITKKIKKVLGEII